MANNLLIATWNVNSILARLPHVTRWLDAVKPDVLCMQETKCTDDKFPVEVFKERGYECLMFGQQSYNGVAILSRAAAPCVELASGPRHEPPEGRDSSCRAPSHSRAW